MMVAILVLGVIGLVAALVLFAAGKKFAVKEDPRLDQVKEVLPGANCGACGYPGCSGFAKACVEGADKGSIAGMLCTVGGDKVMGQISEILHMKVSASEPRIAVVRCNGSCDQRHKVADYDGKQTCAVMNMCGAGESECGYGCLSCGDCAAACQFCGITINPATGLPEVNPDLCTGCGACAIACPRNIIELRPRGENNQRVWVACMNKDKGPVAKKACSAACIGCSLCVKECKFDAITVNNNLAYIDSDKCRLCRSCVAVCPQKAIHES